ncbi:splicing factor, suppressor of white-apricot homolog [Agrilus planipennis]|uniref:Splicing factor, suppressor of white-apricot homolog n=1 Tax=Agrilus planipennis TaxID=224129 RepID=A0A1W4XRW9_AGRPL|nr:splicing factor, suppressor of white-apricot homolog [Agrilus planipennis]
MAKWHSSTESGILRKNVNPDNHEELLVFGYACKLFRDDEKALYIDKGKHLIPWMGDKNLKIDRYDGRSALSELSQFEASREGYDAMRWLGLSESERRIEQLCDEERYYALNINEEEEELYKEEERKRLLQKNNEYQFNYDVQPEPEPEKVPTVEMEDEPYVPPPDLDVPSDIAVPSTVKENTRIEKTALFVSKQGLQMEILIKTKQADNPQFGFLNQQDPLHKYYKHLLMIIKSGRYKVQSKENCTDEMKDEPNENEANDEYYLHPSLLATPVQSAPPPTTPLTIPYRPSANCKYLQLVNRIQGNQQQQFASVTAPTNAELPSVAPQGSAPAPQQLTYEQQQYYQQYYYAMQYYEYYKQMAQQYSEGDLDPKIVQYFQNLSQLSNFMQTQGMQNFLEMQQAQVQMPDNPYAQIVSNLVKNKEQVSFAPVTNLQQGCQQTEGNIAKAPIIYKQDQSITSQNTPESGTPVDSPKPSEPLPEPKEEPKPVQKHPLLHFAHYDSDSNESDSGEKETEEETTFKDTKTDVIPQNVQLIIEKMASYVSKNGTEFENIVKAKGDPRFEFLNEEHKFHSFYQKKLEEFTASKAVKPEKEENQEKEAKKQQNASENKTKEKKAIAPVSFSIKKTKEETPKEIKSALPMEESDEDAEDNLANVAPVSTVQPQNTPTNQINSANCSPSRTPPLKDFDQSAKSCSEVEINNKNVEKSKENDLLDGEDPILEMIDLTDDAEERRENKRAEDRKKDKIAAAARERLSLQLERKRKAAVFLKLMNADTSKADKKTITSSGREATPATSSSKSSSDRNDKSRLERQSSSKEESRKIRDNDSSECEDREVKRRKSSKKKKSHKRKRSKEKHDSRHHHKDHKKSKKRRRSESIESHSSHDS